MFCKQKKKKKKCLISKSRYTPLPSQKMSGTHKMPDILTLESHVLQPEKIPL